MISDSLAEEIKIAVAATLRTAAFWGLSFDTGPAQEELLHIAKQVEALTAEDDVVCPVCEEIECDGGCPLEAVRARFRA